MISKEVDKTFTITDKNGLEFPAHILIAGEYRNYELELSSQTISYSGIKGVDLFDCLQNLRQRLEGHGLFILCQGSLRNIVMSGMLRDMSNGARAYKVNLHQKATFEQLVEIFDPAPANEVVTIAEQEAFRSEWFNSPKN